MRHTTSLASFAANLQTAKGIQSLGLIPGQPSVHEIELNNPQSDFYFNKAVQEIEDRISSGTVRQNDFSILSPLVTTNERQRIYDDVLYRASQIANFYQVDNTSIAPVSTSVWPEPESLAPAGLFNEPNITVNTQTGMSTFIKYAAMFGGAYLLYKLVTKK